MEQERSGLQRRPCPILTKDNSEQWFRRMTTFLKGEDLFHALAPTASQPITPKSDSKAVWFITMCLSDDDEELVSDKSCAKDVWDTLKKKYADNKAMGRKLLRSYFTFQMTEEMDISAAWTHLQALGKKIKAAQPGVGSALEPEFRIQVLLSGLPDQWSSVRDTIDSQPNLSPDTILSILQEKEVDMPATRPAGDSSSSAFAAQAASSRGGYQRKSGKQKQMALHRSADMCYLCLEKGHGVSQCAFLGLAKNVISSLMKDKLIDLKALAALTLEDDDWEDD